MSSLRNARLAQLVEHYLDTVGVTGSSPVLRTILHILHLVRRLGLVMIAALGQAACREAVRRVEPAVVHLLRLAILISLFAAAHATAAPTVKRRDDTYPVTGSSVQELRQMIDRNGPVNKDDGKQYDGLTEWSLTWDYQFKRRGKVWIVSGRSVLLDIKVLTPRWTDFQNTPGALRTKWRIYRV